MVAVVVVFPVVVVDPVPARVVMGVLDLAAAVPVMAAVPAALAAAAVDLAAALRTADLIRAPVTALVRGQPLAAGSATA